MPRVSAVIPTRGRPESVSRAIQSVLRQSYTDIEAVVVIDGDDPSTSERLAKIDDPRLRVIPLFESVGGSEARNVGAREARGRWVALLDDDDVWFPEKIEKQLKRAEESRSRFTLLTSSFITRFSDRDELWPRRFPRKGEQLSEYLFCFPRNVFQTSTLMCNRELLIQQPFLKGLKRLQDWDWLLRVAARGDVDLITLNEALSLYYVDGHESTISSRADWKANYEWAQTNRGLMTPRAYGFFIAKKCAPDAAQQRAGFKTIWMLLRQCVLQSRGSPLAPLLFLTYLLLPPVARRRLGNSLSIPFRRPGNPAERTPERLIAPPKWPSSHKRV